jgi:hypothetical protein
MDRTGIEFVCGAGTFWRCFSGAPWAEGKEIEEVQETGRPRFDSSSVREPIAVRLFIASPHPAG